LIGLLVDPEDGDGITALHIHRPGNTVLFAAHSFGITATKFASSISSLHGKE
jgi:hypothetical protein